MWNLIDKFLDDIAKTQGYERDTLSFVAELCSGGPTIQPDSSENHVDETVTAGPGIALPSGWYDTIGSKHLEYRVIRMLSTAKTKIPIVLYSFQHHPLAGCCRFGLNRWVRCLDNWDNKLQKIGLKFRTDVAKVHGCNTLFVSKGPSGSGATGELYDEFDKLWDSGSMQSLYGIKT